MRQHLQQPQPHARFVGRSVRAVENLAHRQVLGEFDDARLQAPGRFAIDVGQIHGHLERLEAVHAAGLHTEVRHDEVDVRELLDDRRPLGRDAVGAVTRVQLDQHAQFGALLHRRTQPVLGAVGTIGMHVGLELHHLETVFAYMPFQLGHAVGHAIARVVDKAAEKTVRVLLHHLDGVGHVLADARHAGFFMHPVGVDGVALRRLDEGLVDAARLAADGVGAVHHLDKTFAGERLAIMPPGDIHQIGGVATGIDDHVLPLFMRRK